VDVVLWLQIRFSFGEREHALSFARQIRAAGYRPRFVVAPDLAERIRSAGFEPAVFRSDEEGVALVRGLDPGLVIGCELFNLSAETLAALVALGRPIATMDGTTLGHALNTDPFGTPELRRSLPLPDHCHFLRACPVNDIADDTGHVSHWRLFPGASREPKRTDLYASLGLDAARRSVLLPVAPWAASGARRAGLASYHDELLARIVAGLEACGEPIQLVVVAPGARGVTGHGSVSVHRTGLLPFQSYDHLLCSCDAVLSDNIVQTSVSKAVVIGTPHLIIQNAAGSFSASSTGQGGLLSSELPWRCNIFPMAHLFPAEREYARIVDVAEFGDPEDVRAKLVEVLRHGHADAERRVRRADYVARLARLAEPGEILARVVGPPRPARRSAARA
jgi:hypothetical protein